MLLVKDEMYYYYVFFRRRIGRALRLGADAIDLPVLIGRCVSCVGGMAEFTSIRRWVVEIPGGTKFTRSGVREKTSR